MQGSWLVFYNDGTTLDQYDAAHPMAVNGEVPMRCIEWSQVHTLQLASQDVVTDFEIPPQTDAEYRLVQRTMMTLGDSATIFIILVLVPGYAYPFEQRDVLRAMYWTPDGSTHDCTLLQCPEVARYLQQFVWGQDTVTLATSHDTIDVSADAIID